MELQKKIVIGVVCLLLALAIAFVVLYFTGVLGGKHKAFLVGRDIPAEDITEFYYTEATSTYPPTYLRYQYSVRGGHYTLFHEQREGEHFPLTEQDATVKQTIPLSDAQWQKALDTFMGGEVVARKEETASGNAGPFLFLYWKKDKNTYQQFTFETPEKEQAFLQLCETLVQ